MSHIPLQRVIVRMLYDAAFRSKVYAGPSTALADVDVSPDEASWLTALDPRAYATDPHVRGRSLHGLLSEYSVSGGYFADNVAPAIYGGATLTCSLDPLIVIPLGSISELIIILAIPKVQVLTKDSRKVLPSKVELSDCIHNMANTASITAAFCKDDYTLLKDNLYDFIIEPRRAKLIPGFTDVKEAALNAGAHGMTISGSGPTVFAITNIEDDAKPIGSAMAKAFQDNGIKCQTLITKPSADGAKKI